MRGAVIGLGRMGRHHARKLAGRPDVQLSLHDPAQGHAEPLDPGALDFAIVATPTLTHLEVALPLLQAGVACLVEKPLAPDATEAAVLASYPRLSVGHIERFNPAVRSLPAIQPAFVECVRLAPWRAAAPGQRGTDVDVIGDLMVHDLDLVRGWLGPGPLLDVRAIGIDLRGYGLDLVDARLEIGPSPGFAGGVATLRASRLSPSPVRTARLFADRAYWSLDLLGGQAHALDGGDPELRPRALVAPTTDALDAEHEAFLAAVRGEAPFVSTGNEAVAVLDLVQRVRDACLSRAEGLDPPRVRHP